jgi:hypothetical protein
LVLVSVLLLGWTGIVNFLRILVTSADGEGNKFFNENLMVNLIGFLRRTFPSLHASFVRLVGWIGFGVAIIYLCVVWAKNAEIKEKHFGLAIIIMIICVPHIHYHDLVLLLIPIYGIISIMQDKKLLRTSDVVLLPLGISLVMFVSFLLIPGLKYIMLYIIEILILAALWFPEKVIFWGNTEKPKDVL